MWLVTKGTKYMLGYDQRKKEYVFFDEQGEQSRIKGDKSLLVYFSNLTSCLNEKDISKLSSAYVWEWYLKECEARG